ncbi:MAG: hypothetical protein WCK43_02370 [bacterium]
MKMKNVFLFILTFSNFIYLPKLFSTDLDPICNSPEYESCFQEYNFKYKVSNPAAGAAIQFAETCIAEVREATNFCSYGREKGLAGTATINQSLIKANAQDLTGTEAGATATSGLTSAAVPDYNTCGSIAQSGTKNCNQAGLVSCVQQSAKLAKLCPELSIAAGNTAAQTNQLSNAAKSLESAKSDYSWVKPALIGAAVGAGAMALMGGKKSGNSGGTPAPATKPDDKLAPINLNGSTASAAPTPSVVYYPPSNNNGSLGNPAVIGSTTSTSTPADTIKVAGITPSTSFASGQGSSINTDSSSNRTLSSSGAATPASASSVGSGSTDSGGGVGGGGSDSASLVDPSGKSAGGGGSFSGMDGGSGSGSSTQAASADGTMLTGIPGGKSDPQSTKPKALASKKAQVAQIQPSTTNTKPLVRRRLATPPVKVAPPINLKQDMRSRGLIK